MFLNVLLARWLPVPTCFESMLINNMCHKSPYPTLSLSYFVRHFTLVVSLETVPVRVLQCSAKTREWCERCKKMSVHDSQLVSDPWFSYINCRLESVGLGCTSGYKSSPLSVFTFVAKQGLCQHVPQSQTCPPHTRTWSLVSLTSLRLISLASYTTMWG